jgi:hypothetical protein
MGCGQFCVSFNFLGIKVHLLIPFVKISDEILKLEASLDVTSDIHSKFKKENRIIGNKAGWQ